VVVVDDDAPGPVGAVHGSCVGPSIGVMGLTGGREGDDGGDVRDDAEARRGFAMGRGAVVADAGWAPVSMVRPGMVASVIVQSLTISCWQNHAEQGVGRLRTAGCTRRQKFPCKLEQVKSLVRFTLPRHPGAVAWDKDPAEDPTFL
jgi:hypothetical protein